MRGWPLLQFPNQQLESSYHASRSKLFLQVDAWHALLVLLFTPAWLALGEMAAHVQVRVLCSQTQLACSTAAKA
jgi:hypothetical protein